MTPEPLTVVNATAANFHEEVIQRSEQTPVLVDFWASWCEPCKALGPILEKLAIELKGAFVLAKVDIDREAQLAEAFRVQSVPTVVLVAGGSVADGFVGVLPEAQIRQLLEPHLVTPEGSVVDRARELADAGRTREAVRVLQEQLDVDSTDNDARLLLTSLLLDLDEVEQARTVFEDVQGDAIESDEAKAIRARFEIGEHKGDLAALTQAVEDAPNDVEARLKLGRALVAENRHADGLEHLYEAALLDLHHDDDAPRKALLEVFKALGPSDPLTLDYQQQLSVLLC